jgi:histidine phosphotransferase ChpT
MTEAALAPAEPMSDAAAAGSAQPTLDLAAMVAARLCHDFISPASAIVSGLDLLEDPGAQDMREDAMGLIAASARKLVDHLQFCRVAFGASSSAESFDARELETLARGVYAHVRAELVWNVTPASLNKAAARASLNLAQIAAGALPAGGVATLSAVEADGEIAIDIVAAGPRARLRAEVVAGLKGESVGDGLAGQWIQAAYLKALVDAGGGSLGFEIGEDQVTFSARVPA